MAGWHSTDLRLAQQTLSFLRMQFSFWARFLRKHGLCNFSIVHTLRSIRYIGFAIIPDPQSKYDWRLQANGACRSPNPHMSIFSAMLSASSSSTPRYRTVLSTFV